MAGRTERLRQLLDQLLSVAERDLRTATTDPVVAIAHGWFVRVIDTVRAGLLLEERNYDEVAAPLVRTAIEHAVAIAWLAKVGTDGVTSLARGRQTWAKRVGRAIGAANSNEIAPGRTDWSPEIEQVLTELIDQEIPSSTTDRDLNHLHRFETAGAFDLFVAWLTETGVSHATEASAHPYVTDDGDRYHLLRQARRPADSLLVRLTTAAVVAAKAMTEVYRSDVWAATVDRLENELGEAFADAKAAGAFNPPTPESWLNRFDR